jgi:hypothetical protein
VWGVAARYSDRTREACPVGSRRRRHRSEAARGSGTCDGRHRAWAGLIAYMAKREPKRSGHKEYSWSIYRLRDTPAAFIGIVDAPDKASAIKKAIEEYNITDPE